MTQNGRDLSRKPPSDKKNKEVEDMLKEVLTLIPEAPLDCIGATPRNNEMGKTFNPNDMHGPSKHKVSKDSI